MLSFAATSGIAQHVLDGFAYHSDRTAFPHDRIRQNHLVGLRYTVLRFSYEMIRRDVRLCVEQLQRVLRDDPALAMYLIARPVAPVPDDMGATPLAIVTPPARPQVVERSYFDQVRERLTLEPLRQCQSEAIAALANYYRRGQADAACVMSVGAGKTALGVAATLAFTRRRALIVTPGRVIRGTFARARPGRHRFHRGR